MGTNKNVVVSFSIAILLLLSLLLLLTYNSKCNNSQNNKVMTEGYSINNYSNVPEPFYIEKFSSGATDQVINTVEPFNSTNVINPAVSENGQSGPSSPVMTSRPSGPSGPAGPAGSMRGDSTFQEVTFDNAGGYSSYSENSEQAFKSCFPRDRLTADDLLPKDAADSKWARINPSGGGNIGDQNYLTAGYHVGVNTVGQSLRNANLQLRSEIPNPQKAIGPWMISTIEPDLRQNTLEIGSSATYGGSSSY
jgi:hypothetical protein